MAQAARLNLRMQKELKLLLTDAPPGASFPQLSGDFDVSSSSLSSIDAQIEGPEGTVYANGIFKVKIHIPERYPFQPPSVTLATPIYHPNIDTGGRICLDILNLPPKGAWQPSLNISSVLTSIRLLLSEPNPDDGLMCEVSREYKYDRPVFDQKAKSMTEKYAKVWASGNSSQIIQIDTGPSQMEVQGMNMVPKHEVHEDNCSHTKPSGICRKLSWESSGSMQKKEGNGEVSELPDLSLENQTLVKRPKKEPKGAVHDSNPSHEKLSMGRKRLSLECIHKTKKRDNGHDKENGVPNYCPSLLNSQSSSLRSELLLATHNHYVAPSQKDQGGESNDCSSFSSGKPCWTGQKLSLESSKMSDIVSSNDEKIIESCQLSSSQRESSVSHKALPTIQTIEHNGLQQNNGCVNGTGHEVTNSKLKKQHSSGRKLSLGLLGSLKREDSNKNKDDVLTDKAPLSHPIGLSMDSLKRQSNEKDEVVDVPGAEESQMPETIIVLDSEDSDEERNISQRSRLPLACKRLAGKWRAKA